MPNSLGRRPQATVFSVEDLVMRVRRGEVRVPRFQRRLNWRAKDIKLLFDSIYRGYPIGSLLFWKREAPADSVKLGPVTVDAPASRDAWWVVDGQQRITSLVGVLMHPDPVHGRDDYALGIDLQSEEFVRSRPSLPKSWMPLSVVLDTTSLLRWLDIYELRAERPEHVTTAHRVARALRDYQFPAYVIEENDEALVRDVFGRLNSAGRKLKPDEVFDALAGGEDSASASTLQAISDSVAEFGFGRFERAWILKSVQAVAGHDSTTSGGGAALPRDRKAHAATERALRSAAIFLRRDAGIQHASLLPYSLPIPILARFFHLHPSPLPRSRDLLARWFWRGAITGDHQGGEIRQMLAAIDLHEEVAIQSLLQFLTVPRESGFHGKWETLAPFAWRTARTKLEINALLSLGPRDFTTGHPFNVAKVLEQEGASALQLVIGGISRLKSSRWLRRGLSVGALSSIANRIFYPLHQGSLTTLLPATARHPAAKAILASHGFSTQATQEMLQVLDPGTQDVDERVSHKLAFLKARTEFLTEHTQIFLLAKAHWHETDRPSLDALTIPDSELADA